MTSFLRYWVPSLAWMAVIWGISSDLGSAANTTGVFVWVVNALFPWASPTQVRAAHFIVRKLGHLTEYAILAALWFRAFRAGHRLAPTPSALASLAISLGWAIADELHQMFVPSRTASPVDVLIDTTGAALALVALHTRTSVSVAGSSVQPAK